MITTLYGPANGILSLDLREQFGLRVEFEAYNFIMPPIEYRFCRDSEPICKWRRGDTEFHDLQRTHLP